MIPGAFLVKLTVTDDEGLKANASVQISVNEPPRIFPVAENAQWVYRVKSTNTENGAVTGYEEGTSFLVVTYINLSYTYTEFMTLRVTGKKYYNESLLGNIIKISHAPGKTRSIAHNPADPFKTMIDLNKTSWNDFAMFFSMASSQSVSLSTATVNIGLGSFQAYKVRHHRDNWGQNYVSERYDITEEEYVNPQIGLLYRKTSRYVDFLDCFYCPVYGGGDEIELIGYYIPQSGGEALQGGTGYNPDNPYGGNLGLLTFWAGFDIGYTKIYLDGEFVGAINNYWPSGLNCDQDGALNVFMPDGSYWLTASSPKGINWQGTVYFVEGSCQKIEILPPGKGSAKGNGIPAVGE